MFGNEQTSEADELGPNIHDALIQALLLHKSPVEEWCADIALSTPDRVYHFDKVQMALQHLQLCRGKLNLLSDDEKMWIMKDEMSPIANMLRLSCAIVSLRLTLRALFQCMWRNFPQKIAQILSRLLVTII